MVMDGRNYTAGSGYRFGFNGQEKENDISGVEGGHLVFEYRIHDARLGRFLSVDPLSKKYPWNSPYAFAENDVISFIDLEGLEKPELAASATVGTSTAARVTITAAEDVGTAYIEEFIGGMGINAFKAISLTIGLVLYAPLDENAVKYHNEFVASQNKPKPIPTPEPIKQPSPKPEPKTPVTQTKEKESYVVYETVRIIKMLTRSVDVPLPYFGITKNVPAPGISVPFPANSQRYRYTSTSTPGQNIKPQMIATDVNFDYAVGIESCIIFLNSTWSGSASVRASTRIDNLSASTTDFDPMGRWDAVRLQLGMDWLNKNRPTWRTDLLRVEQPASSSSTSSTLPNTSPEPTLTPPPTICTD
jgi:RHS repeat-associated protein